MKNCDSQLEETLDDDIWKDSFDRLLNKRSLLRELKVIKKNVRISFNNDSSIEASKNNISQNACLETNKNSKQEKRKPCGSISTPICQSFGPFDCPLSPISSWRLTHFNQRDAWESCNEIALDKVAHLSQQSSLSSINAVPNPSMFNSIPIIKIQSDDEINQTHANIIEENNLRISGTPAENANVNVLLPPGKWRRSLTVWKKLNKPKCQYLDHNSKTDSTRYSRTVRSQKQVPFLRQRSTQHIYSSIEKSQVKLLKICDQRGILSFSSVYSDAALRKCRKIGEGTYGEVFLNSNKDGETVLKIIPIEGDVDVNGECQKTFEQILPEVIITRELSNLRQSKSFSTSGFVFLKNVRCFKGKYPEHMLELWNLYEQNYGSENDNPGIFKDNQLYVSLEIAYGGKDLEEFIFRNSEQAYAAFLQVTLSLAIAEKLLEFEHRDLHCGNILIQTTSETHLEFTINDNKINIPTSGVKVTIIDYTLSRMLLNKCCYYNDLSADEELFCAKGDYQYDIYRLMRTKLRNDWKTHDPQTNVMWLHYILTKLVDVVKYKNRRSKQHTLFIERMKKMQNIILTYSSALEFANKIYD